MFQVDDGKAVVVQPVRPAAHAFGETSRALTEHLDTLLGEQLLPVRVRTAGKDEPYLLAVDCHGHPVVVEIAALLDPSTIVRALRYTGRVARMSLRDVGALHPEGRERFARDLALFRDSVPVAELGVSAPGARLLLVCSEVGEGMDEVVEALTQPGRGVDVLQVGVLDSPDGPQLLDVSPVRRPTSPSGPVRATAPAAQARPAPAPSPAPTPAPVPAGRRQVHPAPDSSTATRPIPVVVADGVPHRVSTGVRVGVPAPVASNGHLQDAAPASSATAQPPASASGRRAARSAEAHRHSHAEPAVAGDVRGQDHGVRAPARAPAFGPDSRLVALAAERGGNVVLVWSRPRRGLVHEALLHQDGSIELADGTRATDPSAAAEIASGAQGPVDGWRVWHVEESEGPTLAQAVGSVAAAAQPQP